MAIRCGVTKESLGIELSALRVEPEMGTYAGDSGHKVGFGLRVWVRWDSKSTNSLSVTLGPAVTLTITQIMSCLKGALR